MQNKDLVQWLKEEKLRVQKEYYNILIREINACIKYGLNKQQAITFLNTFEPPPINKYNGTKPNNALELYKEHFLFEKEYFITQLINKHYA